ncbi:MAG TPA: sigma-70 family RNA polymerase sigma factor [Planctomycetota bacterium]|nr:sigma-70 family RNA polymerase sigma factor [Planctomycetota bacterium]
MSDDGVSALVQKSRAGDKHAFSALVVRFQDLVYNIIHQRLGDADATFDAAQETFVKAFTSLDKLRADASFKAWLLAIALREAENVRRRAKRGPRIGGDVREAVDQGPLPSSHAESAEDVLLVRRALEEASEEDARLVLLRDLENLSYAEIADALGIPIGSVRSGLHRARARIRVALEKAHRPTVPASEASA